MADAKFELILRKFFLKISNTDISYGERIFTWKSYTTNKDLPTTKHIDKKDFIIATFDANSKTFVMYVAIRKQEKLAINLPKKT